MTFLLGKECSLCSSLLNGLIYEFKEGYVGFNCCITSDKMFESKIKNYWRIDTAKETEEVLSEHQLLSALQSSVAIIPLINTKKKDNKTYYTLLYKHKYKRL